MNRILAMAPSTATVHGGFRSARRTARGLVAAVMLGLLVVVAMWSSTHLELDAAHTEHAAHAAVLGLAVVQEPGPASDVEAGTTWLDAAPAASLVCILGVLGAIVMLGMGHALLARRDPLVPLAEPASPPPPSSRVPVPPPASALSLSQLSISRT